MGNNHRNKIAIVVVIVIPMLLLILTVMIIVLVRVLGNCCNSPSGDRTAAAHMEKHVLQIGETQTLILQRLVATTKFLNIIAAWALLIHQHEKHCTIQ